VMCLLAGGEIAGRIVSGHNVPRGLSDLSHLGRRSRSGCFAIFGWLEWRVIDECRIVVRLNCLKTIALQCN